MFARLWWTVHPPGARKIAAYQRGVARGLLASSQDVPVLRVMLRKFDSPGEDIPSDKGYNFRNSAQRFGSGIWEWMARRYNVSVRDLHDLEDHLSQLPAEPLFLRHPILDRMRDVDLADIFQRGMDVWPGECNVDQRFP